MEVSKIEKLKLDWNLYIEKNRTKTKIVVFVSEKLKLILKYFLSKNYKTRTKM